jgi:hypothetical protein
MKGDKLERANMERLAAGVEAVNYAMPAKS